VNLNHVLWIFIWNIVVEGMREQFIEVYSRFAVYDSYFQRNGADRRCELEELGTCCEWRSYYRPQRPHGFLLSVCRVCQIRCGSPNKGNGNAGVERAFLLTATLHDHNETFASFCYCLKSWHKMEIRDRGDEQRSAAVRRRSTGPFCADWYASTPH
jgi:hypothetical protein